MKDNKIIGSKIQHIREMKQLSVEDVAERSGLSVEQIQRIEGNVDFPSLAPLIKIARVLGVRLGTFLDDQSQLGPVVCRKGTWLATVLDLPTTIRKVVSIWLITLCHKTSRDVTWNRL